MATPSKPAKVLIVIGDAAETLDTLYPYYRLQEDGFEPVVVAPEARRYQMVMHEVKPGWCITKEWEGYTLEAKLAFKDVDPEDYLGIMFSGGRAPEYIRYDPDLVRITRHFFERSKPIASVCHGVEIPAYAGCVKGRKMATVAKCKFDLEVCGGKFVDEACVVDGNLVSGRTYHDNGKYLGPWIKMLIRARDEATGAAISGGGAATRKAEVPETANR
jgi:protease I